MNPQIELNAVVGMPEDLTSERTALVARARELQIVDQASYDFATQSFKDAATLEKRIVEHYEPLRETTKAAYDTVLDAKKRDLEPVVQVKQILSRSIAAFELEQARERQREQARRDEEALKIAEEKRQKELADAKKAGATKKEIEEIKKAPVEAVSPEVKPTFERSATVSAPIERWSAEVRDLMLLVKAVAAGKQPLNLLLPNQPALNGMARALKNTMGVPGVEAVCEATASVRGR